MCISGCKMLVFRKMLCTYSTKWMTPMINKKNQEYNIQLSFKNNSTTKSRRDKTKLIRNTL